MGDLTLTRRQGISLFFNPLHGDLRWPEVTAPWGWLTEEPPLFLHLPICFLKHSLLLSLFLRR